MTNQQGLQATLTLKILLTVVWAAALLLAPSQAARWLGFPEPEPELWARLLGAAFTALLVGYCVAFRDNMRGGREDVSITTLWVGSVSNGLGGMVLLKSWPEWRDWGGALAQASLWVSMLAAFVITVGLIVFGLIPWWRGRRSSNA
jgi:ABC-type Mn2+/Zn2+ transport system permease subunit